MAKEKEEDTTLLARSIVLPPGGRDGDTRAHYLNIVEGDGKGRQILIGNEPMEIGRSAPAHVVLPDPRVSRTHCRVCLVMGEVIVLDLGSSNGTFIDGKKIEAGAPLAVGARLQVGSHVLEHEYRNRKEVEASQELDRDLDQAWHYIQSLLPPPLADGPIRSDWVLVPCARLGGDAFGYRYLDASHFAFYLIDVSGHGTGAAMHAVSVINVLRQNILPAADYLDPGKVLTTLNDMFRMETHGNLYFTVWYGVYDLAASTLAYASAGHHPAFIVEPARENAIPLRTPNAPIGVTERPSFKSAAAVVPPGSMLYLFSDGVYEIVASDGTNWGIEDFVKVMTQRPVAGMTESLRLLQAVRELARNPSLDDDFSLMAFNFADATRSPESTWTGRS
ncbi:MAG: PP2C family protein-serine/threonine phosphatase [Bacillota bacterium]